MKMICEQSLWHFDAVALKYLNEKAAWSIRLSSLEQSLLWLHIEDRLRPLGTIIGNPNGADLTWTTHSNVHTDDNYSGSYFLTVTLFSAGHELRVAGKSISMNRGECVLFSPLSRHSLTSGMKEGQRWAGITFHLPLPFPEIKGWPEGFNAVFEKQKFQDHHIR